MRVRGNHLEIIDLSLFRISVLKQCLLSLQRSAQTAHIFKERWVGEYQQFAPKVGLQDKWVRWVKTSSQGKLCVTFFCCHSRQCSKGSIRLKVPGVRRRLDLRFRESRVESCNLPEPWPHLGLGFENLGGWLCLGIWLQASSLDDAFQQPDSS